MVIRFVDNHADNMSFYVKPEATFIPPHELKEPDTRLKGFSWREDERPSLLNILNATSPETKTQGQEEGKIKADALQVPDSSNEKE
jgi:hypothetical protein